MQEAATAWKISQLTDGELIGRRAEIERKLAVLAADSPRVALLRGELGEIADEEKDRIQIRQSGGADDGLGRTRPV